MDTDTSLLRQHKQDQRDVNFLHPQSQDTKPERTDDKQWVALSWRSSLHTPAELFYRVEVQFCPKWGGKVESPPPYQTLGDMRNCLEAAPARSGVG